MIVAKKTYDTNYPVYNNNALDYKRYEDYQEIKKGVGKKTIKKPKNTAKNKLKLITFVLLMFCMGTFIIARYAFILEMNSQSRDIKAKIASGKKENESLKLELLKYHDIKQIEKEATTELSMVRPGLNSTVFLSVSMEDETKTASENEQNKKVSMLDKLVNMFN